jgi:hypothetical protein
MKSPKQNATKTSLKPSKTRPKPYFHDKYDESEEITRFEGNISRLLVKLRANKAIMTLLEEDPDALSLLEDIERYYE